MNGVELFDSEGAPVLIRSVWASSETASVSNLTNGMVLKGCLHDMFYAPVSSSRPLEIKIELEREYSISMIRIWNMWTDKKSWKKGARLITMNLDKNLIFAGQIAHSSESRSVQSKHEMILFTQNESIIQELSENDWLQPVILKEETHIDELALKELKSGIGQQLLPAASTRMKLESTSSRNWKDM